MSPFKSAFKQHYIYIAYFCIVCFYMILLRLKFIPSLGAYLFYIFFIFSAVAEFCRPGLKTLNNKSDVFLILFFFVYYFLSSIIYVGIIDPCVPMDWLPKDLLYSLLPILFYVLVRLTRRELDAQLLLRYTLVAIITYDIIALLILFMPWTPIVSLFESETVENEAGVSFALSGIVGVIGTGFLNVIGFAICMLSPIRLNRIIKYSLSVVLFICVLLSGQRTPIGGLAIVLIVSLFSFNKKYFLGVSIVLFILALLYYNTNLVVNDLEIKDALFSRYFDRLDILMSGDSGRDYQYQILNDDNFFSFLFGAGVGKYSPENPYASLSMPDAMIFRIFNEMGLLGTMAFLLFFAQNIFRALKKRNGFMIAVITYAFFANCFNRVLFAAPISVIPYVIIAALNWSKNDMSQTRIDSNR